MASILRRFTGGAASTAGGFAIGGAIRPTLDPLTQKLANETWARFPDVPLAPEEAADEAARGLRSLEDAHAEAVQSGVDAGRFARLVTIARQSPPVTTLLELRRRSLIDDGALRDGLLDNAYRERWHGPLAALRAVLPSVTDMVRFAVREVYDPGQRAALDLDAEFPDAFANDAERIGLDRERAGQYWASHWQLPSREEGAAMLHRGAISAAQFTSLLKALDYAPTWRAKLQEISRPIPPLQDMIRFAVREVYDPAKRRALGLDAEFPDAFAEHAALHGMVREDAQDYWAAHWRLPSAEQGFRMLWRGQIDAAELDGLLKALDYPTLWRDRLAAIAYLVPGRIDLRRMFAAGIIDRAEVKRGYQRLGYTAADAETLTRFAEHLASGPEASAKWADRARSRLFTVAHNEYLDRSLDEAGARTVLAQVGAGDAEQDAVLAAWNAELGISRLELTPAQIRKAWKKAIEGYTEEFALAELQERGMTAEDAAAFLHSA